MASVERMTITMPIEMAETLRQTVSGGEYASTSEIVREALRGWIPQSRRRAPGSGSPAGGDQGRTGQRSRRSGGSGFRRAAGAVRNQA